MSQSVRRFLAGDRDGVRGVMEAAFPVDRMPGVVPSEIERALERIVPDPDGTVVALHDGAVVGYCTPRHDDLTVHPAWRRREHGRRLIGAALVVERERGRDALQLHVPLHLAGSIAFAGAMGMRYRSSLWQFRLPATHDVPAPVFPTDVIARTWDPARDTDFESWVRFLASAFDGHPTPMEWSPTVIAHVHGLPDFDPSMILVLSPADTPDTPVAFCRVELTQDGDGQPIGEVGLIGVLPAWRGRGLGREALRWGVTDLRRRGAGRVDLAVEAENERATALYRAHGFEPAIEWPHWVLLTG